MQTVFFYILAAFTLLSAYWIVTARNLFHGAVGLIAALLGIAGVYLLLDAQFLSAIQVTVYIGGTVVLIVFVILLVSDVTQKAFERSSNWRQGMAVALALGLLGLMSSMMLAHPFSPARDLPAKSATVEEIGRALLSPAAGGFVLPFELISLVLVAALIGAVTVARPEKENPAAPEEQP